MTLALSRDESASERAQTLAEEVVNALTHGLGAILAIAAATVLITLASLQDNTWKIVGVSIYGACLIVLYLASTLYHGIQHDRTKGALNIADNCAIYLLIAGTYTPFLLINLRGVIGWTLFGLVWGLALAGIAVRLIWRDRFRLLHLANYLLMGWLMLAAAPDIDRVPETVVTLLAAGGIAYTVGVVFYILNRVPYAHAIWHLFVLAGSTCHCIAVFSDILNT